MATQGPAPRRDAQAGKRDQAAHEGESASGRPYTACNRMNLIKTELPEVVLLEPRVFEDERGLSFESYNRRRFKELTGDDPDFVQDNRSRSVKNAVRGLHYQIQQ